MSKKQDIQFDQRNYRRHGEKNKALIEKSLRELGAGRSIVLDKSGTIIAGNGVFEQAQKLGINVKVIESDGNTLYAIKRTDLSPEDEKRLQLAIADNKASDLSDFDVDLLQKAIDDTMPSASEKRRYVELKSEIKELESVLDIAEVMLTESPSS